MSGDISDTSGSILSVSGKKVDLIPDHLCVDGFVLIFECCRIGTVHTPVLSIWTIPLLTSVRHQDIWPSV